jgi:nucleoid-associated protein YgaU
MEKRTLFSVLAIVLLAFAVIGFGCKTAPKTPEKPEEPTVTEKPVEKPVEKPPEVTEKPTEKPSVEPVSDEEIRQARNAIARAREADAEYYEPGLLKEAEDALDAALRAREEDPEKARELLAEAKAKAEAAFEGAVAKAAVDLDGRLARLQAALLEEKADRFLPEEYEQAVAGIPEVRELYAQGELVDAREKAYATLAEMSGLLERLRERKRWVEILKRDINQNLAKAEELDAHVRAPEPFERARRLYLQGIDEYQSYELSASEDTLAQAKEASQEAIRLASAKRQQEKERTKGLMLDVMRLLEDVSSLTVVTDEGTVIQPAPWSGQQFLDENVEPEAEGESLLIRAGETAVLADVAEENLLEQAKQLWQQGVLEWNNGNFGVAEEYFGEARRLADVYKNQAVNPDYPVYVVRLIPERRDCLWRIAEYEYIYGNPYLWPKIWRRNRKLIQHPDLIYPGWKLVIPPQ